MLEIILYAMAVLVLLVLCAGFAIFLACAAMELWVSFKELRRGGGYD